MKRIPIAQPLARIGRIAEKRLAPKHSPMRTVSAVEMPSGTIKSGTPGESHSLPDPGTGAMSRSVGGNGSAVIRDERPDNQLDHPPIIEAIVGFDCMMPPTFILESVEDEARGALRSEYPRFRHQHVHESQVTAKPNEAPKIESRTDLRALQFFTDDEEQLVQFQKAGFSFNKLAPYTSLDDYKPAIERAWMIFQEVCRPESLRRLTLRFINRMLLPLNPGRRVELPDYLTVAPCTPEGTGLEFSRFLHRHEAVEEATGHAVTIVLASEPVVNDSLPVILDITVSQGSKLAPEAWQEIDSLIESLRDLKNRVFHRSLTPKCRQLFQEAGSR